MNQQNPILDFILEYGKKRRDFIFIDTHGYYIFLIRRVYDSDSNSNSDSNYTIQDIHYDRVTISPNHTVNTKYNVSNQHDDIVISQRVLSGEWTEIPSAPYKIYEANGMYKFTEVQ